MKCTYPKDEKLKSRKLITTLFTEGKSVSKYPLRLVYATHQDTEHPFLMGVSVSKKYFKRAVDRNHFKRILRETYRLNQHILKNYPNEKPMAFMLLYQSKDLLDYHQINTKTIELFEKFLKSQAQNTLPEQK
ncbi:MAG TPA: ribonuclease P protein component [Flavobacterium sp.]|nr:ribonuclease P protein component [Flavobacterium sp.]